MGFFNEDLLVRARNFISRSVESIAGQDECPALVLYHGDGDGCCAAYFLKRFIVDITHFVFSCAFTTWKDITFAADQSMK